MSSGNPIVDPIVQSGLHLVQSVLMPLIRSPNASRKSRTQSAATRTVAENSGKNGSSTSEKSPALKVANPAVHLSPEPAIVTRKKGTLVVEEDKSEGTKSSSCETPARGEDCFQASTEPDIAIKKLGDNVFSLWGGRSRSPSADPEHEQDEKEVKGDSFCKGGQGKLKCGKVVDPALNGEAGIECDKCGDWYHATCQMVPKAAVTAVGRYSMIHWFCSSCRVGLLGNSKTDNSLNMMACRLEKLETVVTRSISEQVESLTKAVTRQNNLVTEAFKHQEEMENNHEKLIKKSFLELRDQKTSYADAVKGSCDRMLNDISAQLDSLRQQQMHCQTEKLPSKDIYTTIGSVMDSERRKLNVVIHNLPECEPTEDNSREQLDMINFEETMKKALSLRVRSSKCFRVGKKREGHPRLLIVTLQDMETKMELLRSASQLRKEPEWRNIFINPDLTPAEREVNKRVKTETGIVNKTSSRGRRHCNKKRENSESEIKCITTRNGSCDYFSKLRWSATQGC